MNQHRAFEVLIDDDKNKIIFIPALQKLFLVPIKTKIPKFIDSEKEAVICYSRPPDYKFRATHLIINNKCKIISRNNE